MFHFEFEMSCLLPIPANEINLIRENGLTIREFSKIPAYPEYNTYDSFTFLMYQTKKKINFFHSKNYRNHFTLYISGDSIVIVLTETTLIYTGTDVTLNFHVIKPTLASRVFEDKWSISFDKIDYNKERPNNFSKYTLHSSGEWWFFDRGVILNGLSANLNSEIESIFIYYELHPPDSFYMKLNNKQTTSFLNNLSSVQVKPQETVNFLNLNQTSTNSSNNISNDSKNSNIFTVNSLPDILSSRLNKIVNLKQTNNTVPLKGNLQNFIPSLFWFECRAKELESSNIDYFKTHSNITLVLNNLT